MWMSSEKILCQIKSRFFSYKSKCRLVGGVMVSTYTVSAQALYPHASRLYPRPGRAGSL
jgi:hypothetical protein